MPVTRRTNKGVSLSRGPALALGTFLVIAGLYFIYMEHGFPRLSQFPNGTAHVNGKAFFGVFGLNGWSGELTVAAGGLLMLGAAQHTLAKTASFVVAVVLAGVGIWALVNHHSALGLFAANIWTIILWFAAAAYLLINTLMPRAGRTTDEEVYATRTEPVVAGRRAAPAPTAADEPTTAQPAATAAQPAATTAQPAATTAQTEPNTVVSEPNNAAPAADTTGSASTNDDGTLRRPATRV